MSNLSITDANFEEEVIKHKGLVLVDFWANWCPPCHAYAPIIEKVAAAWEGKVKVVKLEVDENPKMAEKFGILSLPTTMFFKNGSVVEQLIGVQPEIILNEIAKKHSV